MPNAQDGILQNDICQPNDVVEFLQPSECNQSPTMARPRPQTCAEMLMPRRHYEAMIRARAAEERNNILWPDSMVLERTEQTVGQSCQSQELHLPIVLNSHANNMAVNSTILVMDDSILPIPPMVMPHAQDGILHNGISQINGSTQYIIDHSGEPIAQRVMPNAQEGILQNGIRQPIDLPVIDDSLDKTYVCNSDDQSLSSDSSSADDSELNAIPPPPALSKGKPLLQNPEGHECTICRETHHLHNMALGTFQCRDGSRACPHVFCHTGLLQVRPIDGVLKCPTCRQIGDIVRHYIFPTPPAQTNFQYFLQQRERHECTICHEVHHLHNMALGTFQPYDGS
jgi:hypothetical protein